MKKRKTKLIYKVTFGNNPFPVLLFLFSFLLFKKFLKNKNQNL